MPFELTAKQREALAVLGSDARHILLEGGSRSGKTFIILRTIALRAIAAPGSRHAVLRFRFNAVRQSVVHDTWPKMMQLCFPQVPYRLDKQDWFCEFPNGAQVWFGGLDDKERTEKILGQEYATLFLNEISQIPYSSRNLALTRLAQLVTYERDGSLLPLRLKAYYDCNPPSKGHWAYQVFHQHNDPDSRKPIPNADEYAYLRLNPKDNLDNLPAEYLKTLESLPKRLRTRFLEGEYADATPNALWSETTLERARILGGKLPDWQRVIVGVDPSGSGDTDNAENDEIGISVCALGTDGLGYVLEDLTIKAGPARWGNVATAAYERHTADLVVGEDNFGGAMVEHVIQTARPRTPYKAVKASRGKVVRAEPIASLFETGKAKLVGEFRELEAELCGLSTTGYTGEGSPNRADAMVWAMSELFPGMVQPVNPVWKEKIRYPALGIR